MSAGHPSPTDTPLPISEASEVAQGENVQHRAILTGAVQASGPPEDTGAASWGRMCAEGGEEIVLGPGIDGFIYLVSLSIGFVLKVLG